MKAALLHQPGADAEGKLMRAIGRSAPAPQGLCVLNADGQVLDWTLMFDAERSVLDFLDQTLKRFAEHPDGKRDIRTERFMRFPSRRLEDVTEAAKRGVPPQPHIAGSLCPQQPRLPAGTLVVRVHGRALDAEGKLSNDTTNQEHYAEDRFQVSPVLQKDLADLFAAARTAPVKIPDDFAHLLIQHAYLGHLDVCPLRNPAGAASNLKLCELWARRDARAPGLFRIAGQTEVNAEQKRRNDGAGFSHQVALTWEGIIQMNAERITRLLLTAKGKEQLNWLSNAPGAERTVAHLPAGRSIDMACGVRYGIVGEPAGPDGTE